MTETQCQSMLFLMIENFSYTQSCFFFHYLFDSIHLLGTYYVPKSCEQQIGLLFNFESFWSKVASNFPFINILKMLGCDTNRDSILLATLRYLIVFVFSRLKIWLTYAYLLHSVRRMNEMSQQDIYPCDRLCIAEQVGGNTFCPTLNVPMNARQ